MKLLLIATMVGMSSYSLAKTSPFYRLNQPHKESILFKRLSDGKIIYESNSNTLLSPASVTKLFTSATALAKFSPAYKFETKVYYTGQKKDGIISGDLYFVGSGDPLLVSEKLWQMAADFKHMGIKTIRGDIVVDNSLFDDSTWDKSRAHSQRRSNNAYDAPVSAFGINFNTFPIAFAPGYKVGDQAFMQVDPYPIDGITLKNGVKTASNGKPYVKVTRSSENQRVTVLANGRLPHSYTLKKVYRSVSDPVQIGGEQIRSFLGHEEIKVMGKVRSSKLPVGAKELYTIESYEVSRMISGLNKYSNNYIADVLIKRLGAQFSDSKAKKVPGSLQNGMDVLRNFLDDEVKIPKNYELYNGSGLDTRNRVNAQQVVALLEYMYKRMDLFPEFLASLPAAGWDGTLEDRFKKRTMKTLHGHVRAKTGTLTKPVTVSSLAGYMGHPHHGIVAFAILENGVRKKQQPSILDFRARQEDALIGILEKF